MSKKRKKNLNKKADREKCSGTLARLTGQLLEYLLAAVVTAVCVVVPLYAKDGYHQIGNAKFEAYRRMMIGGFGVLLVTAAVFCICRAGKLLSERSKLLQFDKAMPGTASKPAGGMLRFVMRSVKAASLTDKFVLTYLILTGISVVSGGFYGDALWGAFGWNMGLLSQVSFVLLYLFLSRFGRYYRVMLLALCLAAAVVFGIGILHRLMIDPIGFYDGLTYEQKAQFLSTLGQATWYAAFLAVTLPVGIAVFLYGTGKRQRILSGIYVALGFGTMVTQNSDSAYFAFAGSMLVFFVTACEKRETLCRWTAILTGFFGAGKMMYGLTRLRPNPAFQPDFVTELMWTSWLTWALFLVCLLLALLLYMPAAKKRTPVSGLAGGGANRAECAVLPDGRSGQQSGSADWIPASAVRLIRRGTIGVVVGLTVMAALLVCLQSRGILPESIADKISTVSYLNWGDDWGNGRGRIWSFTGRVISEESLSHRIFGVGPDCFGSYVDAYHGEEEVLLWGQKKLTNAHNEWLNMLVNGGILGAAAYVGIYVTAIGRFLRGRRRNFLLVGIAAACVSYMCYNFFCYQQVLCTPFVFIMMGIGEYLIRIHGQEREIAGELRVSS